MSTAVADSPEALTIGDLVTSRSLVPATMPVAQVVRLFEADPALDSTAVVEGGNIGVLMRTRLFLRLGQRFGYALFERRPVGLLAEAGLSVEATADPLEVINSAMRRPLDHLYDDLVIVERGDYRGLVSMRSFLGHHRQLLIRSLSTIDELERSSRRRSQFFANMSHELRTPLVTIRALATTLEERTAGDEALLACARRIEHEAQDLLGTINNVLDASKLEVGRVQLTLEDVSVAEVLRRSALRCEGLLRGKPVRLTVDASDALPVVRADFVKLEQVFTNLIGNAVKFTNAGSVTVRARAENAMVVAEVSDTGIGIEPSALERIWSPFEQADGGTERRFGGTGLGLSIVKSLVDLMHGTVSVESEVGRGTTFRIRLGRSPSSVQVGPHI